MDTKAYDRDWNCLAKRKPDVPPSSNVWIVEKALESVGIDSSSILKKIKEYEKLKQEEYEKLRQEWYSKLEFLISKFKEELFADLGWSGLLAHHVVDMEFHKALVERRKDPFSHAYQECMEIQNETQYTRRG